MSYASFWWLHSMLAPGIEAAREAYYGYETKGGKAGGNYTPLKNQFGIWRYKFPLQIKLILIISNIFINFSIIMFYLQENCIHVGIPCVT